MNSENRDIAIQRVDDSWPGLPVRHAGAVVRARSESWLVRTDDGREVELLRREVHIAYRTTPLTALRVTPAQVRWGLGLTGLVAALIAIVSGVMAPNRSVAASALVDIPKPVPVAEPAPRVIVQTRYIVAPPSRSVAAGAGTVPDQGDARDVPTALRRAFATNDAQSWATGSASGIVVVGATQIESGRNCRDVAILTRAAEGDSTVNNRYCQTGNGPVAVEPASGG